MVRLIPVVPQNQMHRRTVHLTTYLFWHMNTAYARTATFTDAQFFVRTGQNKIK
jgi:hypothetical protein